jgi:hypothetical protein
MKEGIIMIQMREEIGRQGFCKNKSEMRWQIMTIKKIIKMLIILNF